MKYRKLLPETVRELRELGFDPEIHNGGKHTHVVFINDFGVRCRLTFSHGNGGIFRTYKNSRAVLRRMLRAHSQGELKMSSIVPSTPPSAPAVPKRPRVQDFLNKHDPVRARLVFASDATASREHLWDMSTGLTGEMFNAVAMAGTLDCQLVHYKGFGKCFASQWVSDPKPLAGIMATVRCEAGYTQIGRVLRHILREHARKKINAAIIISDACEETPADLYSAARELVGVPVFMFQEGNVESVTEVYTEISRITGGAWAKFDASAAAKLADLLKAVAVFAVGGVKALTNQNSEVARLLLTQLKSE